MPVSESNFLVVAASRGAADMSLVARDNEN
jgi:hypothetical protein